MSLKAIKNKIRSVNKTHQVNKAMEAVSAVKMRRSQERALASRPYATAALSILERVTQTHEGGQHALAQERAVGTVCYVVITSDKGLAGNLNHAVLKQAQQEIANRGLDTGSVSIVALGKKAHEFFEKRGYHILSAHENISDAISSEDMYAITRTVREQFLAGRIDEARVVYTHFHNTFQQMPRSRQLVPVSLEALKAVVEDIVPSHGKFASLSAVSATHVPDYTIEPDTHSVLDTLMPQLLNTMLFHMMLESKASEHSARMVAMKNASDKASNMSRELSLQYNKERQAVITREVSEITGGIEAMSEQ